MSFFEWLLGFILLTVYVVCLVTVCVVTFKKGHWILGILGFFTIIAWLVGAILPAKRGSAWEREEAIRMQESMRPPADRAA
ncbi:MAG: hypothetical protein ACREMQ_23885 [Longimicrobiales bacterium]